MGFQIFLLVDYGKVLCFSANELYQNSNVSSKEKYIPRILTVFNRSFFLCRYVRKHSRLKQLYIYYVNQSELLTRFRADLIDVKSMDNSFAKAKRP